MTSQRSEQQQQQPPQQQPPLSAQLTPEQFVGGFEDALNSFHKQYGTPRGYCSTVPGPSVSLTQRQQQVTLISGVLQSPTSGATKITAAAAAPTPTTSAAAVTLSATNAAVAARLNALPTSAAAAAAHIGVQSIQTMTGATKLYVVGGKIVSGPPGVILSIPEPVYATSVDTLSNLPVAVAAEVDDSSPTHRPTVGEESASLRQRIPAGVVRFQAQPAALAGASQAGQTTKISSIPFNGTKLLSSIQASPATVSQHFLLKVNPGTGLNAETVNVGGTIAADSTALQRTSTGGWPNLGNQSAPIGQSAPALSQAAIKRQASLPAAVIPTANHLGSLAAAGIRQVLLGPQQQQHLEQQVLLRQPSRVSQVNVETGIVGGPTVAMTSAAAAANATDGDNESVADAEEEIDPKKRRNRAAAKKCREKKLQAMDNMRKSIKSMEHENEEIRAKIKKFSDQTSKYNELLRQHLAMGVCNLQQQQQQQQQRRIGDIPET